MKANTPDFGGLWVVLPTPYDHDLRIDYDALARLTEFYIEAGVDGIFACSLSSEVYEFTENERLESCRFVARQAAGRVGIVASGNFGEDLPAQARSMQAMLEAGADAAIAIASILPARRPIDEELIELGRLVDGPLGTYECPLPVHRLIEPDELRAIAHSGRYVFMKETSRDPAIIARKLAAAEGTPMHVLQANLRCLPATLRLGCTGMCAIIINLAPELVRRYIEAFTASDATPSEHLFRRLLYIHDLIMSREYPSSAKYLLARRGLPLLPLSRTGGRQELSAESRLRIDRLLDGFDFLSEDPVPPHLLREVLGPDEGEAAAVVEENPYSL